MDRRTFLAAAAQPKGKVKIVSSLPRTGTAKAATDGIVNAIRMAVADFGKGLPFEVEHLDWDYGTARGAWDEKLERENAERAVADADVAAVIGPYNSGAARASAAILNKAGLVQVTPAASYPGLTKGGPLSDPDEPDRYRPGKKVTFCRVCPHDASQGALSAAFAADELKAKTAYVLDDKQLYGLGLAALFKAGCEGRKVKVLGHESVPAATADFAAAAKRVKGAAPDLVYFGGTTASGAPQLVAALRKEGVNGPLLLPDGCYEPAFVDAAGADALGAGSVFVTVGGINPAHLTGRGSEFVKRYKETYDAAPGAAAVYGYEAAAVVLEALRAVGKNDREAVRKAVVGTKDFDKGVLGKWGFDADGDTTLQPLTVTTIEKGKFRAVKVLGTG